MKNLDTGTVAKSSIGAFQSRVEDTRFLRGKANFVDDIKLMNTAFGYVVRSPHAHARVRRIDKTAALAVPGVLSVLSADDVARDQLGELPCKFFPPLPESSTFAKPTHPILVNGKARHVGDRVAFVVAETPDAAKDGGESVIVEFERLPAVHLSNAYSENAAMVWEEADTNLCCEIENGDRSAVDDAFSRAAHVTSLHVRYPRASANSIEPRAALAYFDPIDGRFTICSATQAPYRVKEVVSAVLGIPEISLRVIAPDIGGGYGMKGQVYPEEVLVAWAARKLNRPVKWTSDRSEGLSSDMHGRDQSTEAQLALDFDGRILAMRASITINVGAYLGYSGGTAPMNAGTSYASVYEIPMIHTMVRATFTNSCPVGPYRGSGKPEASLVIERLIDKAMREMSIDPIAIRRQNLVPASAIPYRTPNGHIYDTGDFERVLDKTLQLADWKGFAGRRADSERRGLLRGIGLAMHCFAAGHESERMEIRVDPNGLVALHVGTVATGQGHETMFAQMVSDWLGVPFDHVRVFQGDTDKILFGRGTFAQRSMLAGGSALKGAADEVATRGKQLAAWIFGTTEPQIDFEDGVFRVKDTNRVATFAEIAHKSYFGSSFPEDWGVGLGGAGTYSGPSSYPNGSMICEVEIDPVTGEVKVDRLSAVDDVGVAINPLTLEGQLHGSIAQGLGETLIEEVVYDQDSGQLSTGSFIDYGMPRADNMPQISSELDLIPAKTNPLGVKGGAEAGNVGAPPAIINAILDALSPWGVSDIQLPATPERVWRAINGFD